MKKVLNLYLLLANFDQFLGVDLFSIVFVCNFRKLDLKHFIFFTSEFFLAQQVSAQKLSP